MHEHLRLLDEIRPLRDPVLLAAFSGWSDFGGAASSALEYIAKEWNAKDLAEIDPEPFFDFTVQRPLARLEGTERVIDWPSNRFLVASPPGAQHDFLLFRGSEPHLRWRTFHEVVESVMRAVGAETSVTIAAQPAAVPHTRPLPVTLSASEESWEEQFGLKVPESRYEGPTGIVGVLNVLQRQSGFRNASLWAQAPHYLTVGPNPKAVTALIRVIDRGFGISTPLHGFEEREERFEKEISEAIRDAGEASTYISALEQQYDSALPGGPPLDEGGGASELPTSEELLGDLEQFLKRQRESENDS